jgi:hypothetical protein
MTTNLFIDGIWCDPEHAIRMTASNGKTVQLLGLIDAYTSEEWMSKTVNDAFVLASKFGHVDTVRALLERGVLAECQDGSALDVAAQHGNVDVVRILLQQGFVRREQLGMALMLANEMDYYDKNKKPTLELLYSRAPPPVPARRLPPAPVPVPVRRLPPPAPVF